MKTEPKNRLLLAMAFALVPFVAVSQQQMTSDILTRDYQTLKRSDPWLTSSNAAALVRYTEENIAEALLSITRQKGGLCDYYQSPDVLQADAHIESFYRFNERTVVFGSMSYDNFSGHDMSGSAFIHHLSSATHLPFDLVEDSLNNIGTKHRDTYQLTGAFGYNVSNGFAVGARLDYTSANYAKYKDLRHKNKLMDMQLSLSAYLPLGHWGAVGGGYLYHRTTESLQFSTYGKTDRTYQTLINYAAFIGRVEQFGGTGYTDKSREMPLVSDYNGLVTNLSLDFAHFSFYNAFTYARRKGYYGRRSPYTVTYADHHSDTYHYDARVSLLNLGDNASQHCYLKTLRLDLQLNAENLQNLGATYREQKNDAGASYYDYYTPVKTADKLWVDGTIALTAELSPLSPPSATTPHSATTPDASASGASSASGLSSHLPTWTFQAGLNWHHRHHTAYVYPYFRRQRLTTYEPFVSLSHNIMAAKGRAIWSFTLDGSFRKGTGEPYEDLTFTQPTDKQTPPASMDALLWREYQWLTAPQYAVGGTVKYSFLLPAIEMKPHVSLSLHHRKANQVYPYSQGRDRTQATITLGCTF